MEETSIVRNRISLVSVTSGVANPNNVNVSETLPEQKPDDVEEPSMKKSKFDFISKTLNLKEKLMKPKNKPIVKSAKKRRIGVAGPSIGSVSESIAKPKKNGISQKPMNGENHVAKNIANGHSRNAKVNGFMAKDTSTSVEIPKDEPRSVANGLWSTIAWIKSCFKWTPATKIEPDLSKPTYKLHRKNSVEKFAHINLLTTALILNPAIHGEDKLTKQFSNKLGDNFQLKLAAAHIKDAIHGRGKFGEARAIFKPPHIQKCFRIISSKWWAGLLYLTIAVHCLMMFWEQPDIPVSIGQQWKAWNVNPAVLAVDAICLLVYVVDIVLHTLFLTWRNIWSATENVWMRVEFVFTVFFIIDFIVLVAESITEMRLLGPFRCLRASMLLCKSKNVAHIFNVLLSIISKLGKVFLIIAIFIVTFASIGLHIFMVDYHSLPETCRNETYTWNCTNIYTGAFDHVAYAALHMFVLMSTENYPEFIIPAFIKSWANFFYFGLYLYAGVFFLTAILLAIIVESYWDYSKRHVKQERKQQREELAKAWNLMDPLGRGQLSVDDDQLLKLFAILKPNNSKDENLELLNYISMYGDGLIDSYDWTTKLIETLSFEFEEEPTINLSNNSNLCRSDCFVVFQKMCKYIMHAKAASVAILVLIFIHSIFFCLMWVDISDATQIAIQSTKTAIVAVFVLEVTLRLVADGRELLNLFDGLDMIMVLLAVVGYITWYILWFKTPRAEQIYLGACNVVSGIAVLVRAVFNSQHARSAVMVLRNIYPVMFDLILLVITIIFNFSVIGLEIFQDKTLQHSEARGYEGSYVEYGCGVGFQTFGCSLLVVFQIVTTNDWHEIMLGAMLDAGWGSAFYFVACYLIVDMIVMNLFVAISIEAYKKLARDKTSLFDNGADEMQDTMVGPTAKGDESFTTAARNTLSEIFATSRKSRSSIGSGTLTGFASSPYAVRRGTLGSLGQRTPTPTPRMDENKTGVRSNSPRPVVRVEDVDSIQTDSTSSISNAKQRNIDRRQMAMKQRQNKRKKERRRTKQEEEKVSREVSTDPKLKIEDVVRLKRAVRVIKSFRARNSREMNLNEGDILRVSEITDDMLLGPDGWFPANHVENTDDSSNENDEPCSLCDNPNLVVTPEQDGTRQSRVKFDDNSENDSMSRKARQSSPHHHRYSQTRMRRRTDGTDWRRDIHGDITIMNKDEMHDLNKMIRGGLARRHTQLRSVPSQLAIRVNEELREEDEYDSTVPQVTVSEAKLESQVEEERPPDETQAVNSDTNTLTLTVPNARPRRQATRKKPKPSGDGSIPEWMQKFVDDKQIAFDKDVKLEDPYMSTASSEEEREPSFSNIIVHRKESLKTDEAVSTKKPSPTPVKRTQFAANPKYFS